MLIKQDHVELLRFDQVQGLFTVELLNDLAGKGLPKNSAKLSPTLSRHRQ